MILLKRWEELPFEMKTEEVLPYYRYLEKKQISLAIKYIWDKILAVLLIVLLFPVYFFVAILIKFDSAGPLFFKQIRVTQYGKKFYVYKFRTMVVNAELIGAKVTSTNDARITRIGGILRDCRLDEIPQLINVVKGEMSFVGTRPEVPQYVEKYEREWFATLLLPAGITSETSIVYKDESQLLFGSENPDEIYINKILPEKMNSNLFSLRQFGFLQELVIMFKTIKSVI